MSCVGGLFPDGGRLSDDFEIENAQFKLRVLDIDSSRPPWISLIDYRVAIVRG